MMYVFVFRYGPDPTFGLPQNADPWPKGRIPGGRYARLPRGPIKKSIARYRRQVRRCYVSAMGASDRYTYCARDMAMVWRGKMLPGSALPYAELVVPYAVE